MLPKASTPPPNQHEVEKKFYDFIQERRGFNTAFARHLGHRDDSHVSRMHSPHVPETPSWLWKACVKLDAAFRADPEVGEFALSILASVPARQTVADTRFNDLRRAFSELEAAHANFEDGMATADEVEAAKGRMVEALGRFGVRSAGIEIVS